MSLALALIKSCARVDKVMRSRRGCRPLCPAMSSARTWSACLWSSVSFPGDDGFPIEPESDNTSGSKIHDNHNAIVRFWTKIIRNCLAFLIFIITFAPTYWFL